METTGLELEKREGLPEALRVLLKEYPREGWAADPNFHGLVSFWLDRHMNFRKVMGMLRDETDSLLDRNMDPQKFGARLSRLGGMFVNELHGHHQIEDMHYFPVLMRQESRIERGFEILDHDHHAIDGHLSAFVEGANGVIQRLGDREVLQDRAGEFRETLGLFGQLLERHLTDEEELVVPVILKHGDGELH